MNEHIEDILVGGRPMTKLERTNKAELEYFIRYSLDSDKYKRYMELYEEIDRLNNIINEIEDSIVGKINVLYQVKNQVNAIQELNILLNKIKELKGVDK